MRAPLWLMVLLIMAIVGIGTYAYLTTPLPFGLSSVIRTPGGAAAVGAPGPTATSVAPTGRTAAGQALVLGATSISIKSVQRNLDLTTEGRTGPPGSFSLVEVVIQNAGSEPLTPRPADFRLVDDRGRVYALDPEATRSVNVTAHRRSLLDATVPPGVSLDTLLAFETPADAAGLSLRVTLGYGEVDLPR